MTLALTMCLSAVMNERVVLLLLVPPAVFRREDRADEHLVDRRVELHPRIALGELAGISGEQPREIGVLEIAEPIGHPEVAKVDDRRDVAPLQLGEGEVGEFPVELVGPEVGLVDRRPVAEEIDADFLDAVEILAPALIMAADRHLVDAGLAVVDRRDAVFDPGREHEVGDDSVSVVFVSPQRGRPRAPGTPGVTINNPPAFGCISRRFHRVRCWPR